VENICRAGGNENLGMYLMCLISQWKYTFI
jgi:hypothetical protein